LSPLSAVPGDHANIARQVINAIATESALPAELIDALAATALTNGVEPEAVAALFATGPGVCRAATELAARLLALSLADPQQHPIGAGGKGEVGLR